LNAANKTLSRALRLLASWRAQRGAGEFQSLRKMFDDATTLDPKSEKGFFLLARHFDSVVISAPQSPRFEFPN